jgi:hypothetical protein
MPRREGRMPPSKQLAPTRPRRALRMGRSPRRSCRFARQTSRFALHDKRSIG